MDGGKGGEGRGREGHVFRLARPVPSLAPPAQIIDRGDGEEREKKFEGKEGGEDGRLKPD